MFRTFQALLSPACKHFVILWYCLWLAYGLQMLRHRYEHIECVSMRSHLSNRGNGEVYHG